MNGQIYQKYTNYGQNYQMILNGMKLLLKTYHNALEEGRFPIVLTERREHLSLLESMLKDKVDYLAVLHERCKDKNF